MFKYIPSILILQLMDFDVLLIFLIFFSWACAKLFFVRFCIIWAHNTMSERLGKKTKWFFKNQWKQLLVWKCMQAFNFVLNAYVYLIVCFCGHTFMTPTKNEQFCDRPLTLSLQKWRKGVLFKNNRTYKRVTNFNSPTLLPVGRHKCMQMYGNSIQTCTV